MGRIGTSTPGFIMLILNPYSTYSTLHRSYDFPKAFMVHGMRPYIINVSPGFKIVIK